MTKDIKHITPVGDWVFIDIFDKGRPPKKIGDKTLYFLEDDTISGNPLTDNAVSGQHPGIRPRYAKVLAVNEKSKEAGLAVGDTVLCDYGKWTRKMNVPGLKDDEFVWTIRHQDILTIVEEN